MESKRTKTLLRLAYFLQPVRTIFVGIPFIVFSLAIVVGAFVGFRLWYNSFTEDQSLFRTLVTVANGAGIAVLNTIYKMLAIKVVN